MKKSSTLFVLLALGLAACPLLAGCGKGADSSMSKEEAAQFKGGPMPADAQKGMAAQMQKANAQRAAAGAQGGPPAAAPGKP